MGSVFISLGTKSRGNRRYRKYILTDRYMGWKRQSMQYFNFPAMAVSYVFMQSNTPLSRCKGDICFLHNRPFQKYADSTVSV